MVRSETTMEDEAILIIKAEDEATLTIKVGVVEDSITTVDVATATGVGEAVVEVEEISGVGEATTGEEEDGRDNTNVKSS